MRCSHVEPRLRALMDGELEPAESRQVLQHLEGCAACRAAESRIRATVSLLQCQELEDAPAHFSAALQVRLSSHRTPRQSWWGARVASLQAALQPTRRRWVGGLSTCAVAVGVAAVVLFPRMGAADVAQRAEQSWLAIRNYGCVFQSQGVYLGQPRSFEQRQFFAKPGVFRLETQKDYPLVTYVERDRVIHYLSGGDWKGRGPLVIVRPRQAEADALPFPFGATWQSGGNVSLDRLIRQLNRNVGTQLVGKERVGERDCYHLKFLSAPPGALASDQYEMWVDAETFLPRRVSWYRDEANHIVTEALDLQVNGTLPADTFRFEPPAGAVVIHGDVDPHVFALKLRSVDRSTTVSYEAEPVLSARYEGWARARSVPFAVLTPDWLPTGYELVRVRRRQGRWVDAHWVRPTPGGGDVVKLVEQDASAAEEELHGAEPINLGTRRRPIRAQLLTRQKPYSYAYLSWVQGKTRCLLFASGQAALSITQIARSMAEASGPPPVVVQEVPDVVAGNSADASLVPDESLTPEPQASEQAAPDAAGIEPTPMLPETADEDRRSTAEATPQ